MTRVKICGLTSAADVGRGAAPRLQHDVQGQWQAWRQHTLAGLGGHGPGQPVDQPDLAAVLRRDKGAVHPVDDARQHKAGIPGIKHRAVEQLKIKRTPDADRRAGKAGLMSGDVSVEFGIERAADAGHRRQCEQLTAGEGNITRCSGRHHTPHLELAAVEFAQGKRVGDRRAALQRRADRIAQRQQAAEQDQ